MEYRCPVCSESFPTASSFTAHVEVKGEHIPCTHSGCSSTSKNKQIMKNHVRSEHSVDRPRVVIPPQVPPEPPVGGSWQESINFLIAGNTSPPKSQYLPDSSSKNALEAPHSRLATTASLPSLSTESAPGDGTIESKPAAEVCFEEQEKGSSPIINLPVSTPTKSSRVAVRQALRKPNPRSTPHQSLPRASETSQGNINAMASHGLNGESRDARWSVIPEGQHDAAITKLRAARAHSQELLERLGYFRSSQDNHFQSAPAATPFNQKRRAVALDCEMVGCRDNGKEHSVLARLSVIDYLTGEVIIDSLVQPGMRVTDWRTKYSGVTPAALNAAVRAGRALFGHEGAQKALWKHIDSETVIVGQALTNDLAALKITHACLVDSGVVTAEAAKIPGLTSVGLKIACKELLNIQIQQNRDQGHDSVEDSFAAREVVLFCLNETEKVEQWGEFRREKEAQRLVKIEEQRKEALVSAPSTKPEWPKPVAYRRRNIVVQLPRFQNMLVRDRSDHYEMMHILPLAICATTVSLSKEDFIDLVEEAEGGEAPRPRVKLPAQLLEDSEEDSDIEMWEDAIEVQEDYHVELEEPQELLVDLYSDTPQTLLDQPFDIPEGSFLTAALIPCSPSSTRQPIIRIGSWEDLTA